eukprot:TRINITY_DN69274_c0_g1_i1.p1 TRINITY_DN69274_c0_g1~~TRINITY_DN69274_c0_g1_i1.p1  ORF type:complete len:867 (+),score=199.15 TRINITY_DN69274_c0_g1_i1:156-2756(+)
MTHSFTAMCGHLAFLVIVFAAICPTACALRYEADVGFDLRAIKESDFNAEQALKDFEENSGKLDCDAVRSLCSEVEDNGSVSDDTLKSEGMDLLRATRNDFKIVCRKQLLHCDQQDGGAANVDSTARPSIALHPAVVEASSSVSGERLADGERDTTGTRDPALGAIAPDLENPRHDLRGRRLNQHRHSDRKRTGELEKGVSDTQRDDMFNIAAADSDLAKIAEETREAEQLRAEADLLAAHAASEVLDRASRNWAPIEEAHVAKPEKLAKYLDTSKAAVMEEAIEVSQRGDETATSDKHSEKAKDGGQEKDTKRADSTHNWLTEAVERTKPHRWRPHHSKMKLSRRKRSSDKTDDEQREKGNKHAPELISTKATKTETKQGDKAHTEEEKEQEAARRQDEQKRRQDDGLTGTSARDAILESYKASEKHKALARLRQLDKQRGKGERRRGREKAKRKGKKAKKKEKEHGALLGQGASESTTLDSTAMAGTTNMASEAKTTTTTSTITKSVTTTVTETSASPVSTTLSKLAGDAATEADHSVSDVTPSVKADSKATAMLERKGDEVSTESLSQSSSQGVLADLTVEQEEALAARAAENEVERAAQRAAEAVRVGAAMAIVHTEKRLGKLQDREARVAAAAQRAAAAALSIAEMAVTFSNSPQSHVLLEEGESQLEDQPAQPPAEKAASLSENNTGDILAMSQGMDTTLSFATPAVSLMGLSAKPVTDVPSATASLQQATSVSPLLPGDVLQSGDLLNTDMPTAMSAPASSFVDTETMIGMKQPPNIGSASLPTIPSVYLQTDAFATPLDFAGSAFSPPATQPAIADQFARQQAGWEAAPAIIPRGHAKKIRLLVANKFDGEDDDVVVS